MSQASKRRRILALTLVSIGLVGLLPVPTEARRGFPHFVDSDVSVGERLSLIGEAIFGAESENLAAVAGATGEAGCGWWDRIWFGCAEVAPTVAPEVGAAPASVVPPAPAPGGSYFVTESVIERVVVRESGDSSTVRVLLERLGVLEAQVARFDGRIRGVRESVGNVAQSSSNDSSGGLSESDVDAAIDTALVGDGDASFGLLAVTGAATSTFANGLDIADGCFAVDGVCLGGGASLTGSTGQIAYFSGADTAVGTSTVFISSAGNVGIGTTTPSAALSVVGSVAVTSANRSVVMGDTTGNARGTESLDVQSLRLNPDEVVAGLRSFAFGNQNKVLGDFAGSIGLGNIAGNVGLAFGTNNVATSSDPNLYGMAAFGFGNQAHGILSSSFGSNNQANADYSAAFGRDNIAGGLYTSSAFGVANQALSADSSAFGRSNVVGVGGSGSSAFGMSNTVSAAGASAFGSSITNSTANSVQIGPSDAAKLTILSSGNVGIGSANPNYSLSLSAAGGTIGIADQTGYEAPGGALTITGGTGTSGGNSGGDLILKGGNSYTGSPHEAGDVLIYGGVNNFSAPIYGGAIRLFTSGAERFTVLNDGSIGIGTTTPGSLLSLGSLANFTTATSTFYSTGGINLAGGCFAVNGVCVGGGSSQWTTSGSDVYYSAGNVGIGAANPRGLLQIVRPTAPMSVARDNNYLTIGGGQEYGVGSYRLIGFGYTENGNTYQPAYIGYQETSDAAMTLGDLVFGTRSDVHDGQPLERMRITSTGNVGIGTTSPFAKLSVQGNALISGTTTAGAIYATGTSYIAGGMIDTDGTYWVHPTDGFGNYGKISYDANVAAAVVSGIGAKMTAGGASIGLGSAREGWIFGNDDVSVIGAGGGNVTMTVKAADASGSLPIFRVKNSSSEAIFNVGRNGYVGIGTTTPGSLLSLGSLANFTTATSTFYSTGGINLAGGCFAVNGVCVGGGGSSQWTTTGSDIYYSTGNVGIANASPTNKLDIIGNARIQSGKLILGDQIRDDAIDFYGSQYTLGLRGYTLFAKSPQMFRYESGVSNGAYNAFEIGNSGGGTFLAVNNSGNLGIGTTTPWKKLSVTGTVGFDGLTGSTGAGSLCLSSNNEVVYNSGSDSCLPSLRETKHSIAALEMSASGVISALNSVSFVYNSDTSSTLRYGFIAEEAALVDPHLATYDASGNISGIDDRSILSVLVKAFKEMKDSVDGMLAWFGGDKFTVQSDVCVDDVCVTKEEFKQILLDNGGANLVTPTPEPTPNPEPTPDPVLEIDPGSTPPTEPIVAPDAPVTGGSDAPVTGTSGGDAPGADAGSEAPAEPSGGGDTSGDGATDSGEEGSAADSGPASSAGESAGDSTDSSGGDGSGA